MQSIKISYPYTFKYAVAASRELRSWRYYTYTILISLIFSGAMSFTLSHNPSFLKILFYFVSGTIGWAGFTEVILIYNVWIQHKSSPLKNAVVEWEISENELHQTTPNGRSQLSWDYFYKVREKRLGFGLYANKLIGYWLPNEAFQSIEDREAFAVIASAKAKNFKKK